MEKQTTKIADFWKEDEKEVNETAKGKRLKALQRDAEIAIAGLERDADNADTALEAAIRGALVGTTAMESLFVYKRNAKVARAKHKDALVDYEEFFGEKPKLQ